MYVAPILQQGARSANLNADPIVEVREKIDAPRDATCEITNTTFYVPAVTLSTENDNKLLEQLITGFKRTIGVNIGQNGYSD